MQTQTQRSDSCYRRGCQVQAQDSRFQVWKDCVKILKSTKILTQVAFCLFNFMSLCYFGRDTVACQGIWRPTFHFKDERVLWTRHAASLVWSICSLYICWMLHLFCLFKGSIPVDLLHWPYPLFLKYTSAVLSPWCRCIFVWTTEVEIHLMCVEWCVPVHWIIHVA